MSELPERSSMRQSSTVAHAGKCRLNRYRLNIADQKNLVFYWSKNLIFCLPNINLCANIFMLRGGAEIGRQARLRILCPVGRVGSSPILRRMKKRKSEDFRFLLYKTLFYIIVRDIYFIRDPSHSQMSINVIPGIRIHRKEPSWMLQSLPVQAPAWDAAWQ